MTTAVKRACDACHRRKVKCDGINPCRNCSASQLSCTYNAVPQKKGPKGSRAKVISELRETQRQTSLSAKVQNRMAGINSPPSTPSLAPTPGLLTSELIKDCMEFFFTNMYPSMPILNRHRLEQQAATDQGLDTYCLLTSFCGFMMLQPGMSMPAIPGETYNFDVMPGANIVTATLLLEETLRVRKGYDWLESPTLNTLCTNYFLFGCYYGLDFHDKAWFYLREATTMTHMFGMTKEETYIQSDSTESARRRRLYWLLYVTERAYALQRLRPVTLQATVNLPTAADDPMDPLAHQLGGFVLLVNLFRHFDDAFITLWNKTRGECSPAYIASLQKQLMEVLPQYRNSQDSQLGELQINQQWLKNMQCLASGNAGDMYSIDIGRDLLPMVDHLPGGLGLHGLGLLCGLSDAVVEYLSIQPASRDPFSVGPREHLQQILNIVTMLRQGDHRFLPLLLNKVNDILPRLANPMLQNPPENACNIDIFDGFGNAGMAQPPLFQADEYDNKFAITRIDDLNNDSGSSGGSTVKNDMNSPFVSSPPLMSPGMELRHGLAGDFNPIPDMVMSPMGGNAGSMNTPPSIHNQQLQHQQHQQHQQHHQHHQHQHHHPPQQQQQQHHQPHQQHHILSGFHNLNPQLNLNQNPTMSMANQGLPQGLSLTQGLPNISHGLGNGLTSPLGQGMNGTNMMARQAPQRTNSFAMGPAQIRTVGDFHALQRANSDLNTMSSLGISNMGTEMDFNTLPR